MENWAESTLKLKEHMKSLSDCLLHERWDEVPTLLTAMRMRLDKIEEMVNGNNSHRPKSAKGIPGVVSDALGARDLDVQN